MAQIMTDAGILDMEKFAGSQEEGTRLRLWLYDPQSPGGRREYDIGGADVQTVKDAIFAGLGPKTTVAIKRGKK